MPARYVILKEQRLVVNIGWGRLIFEDFRQQQDQLTSDPEFDPAFDQFVDISQVTALDISAEQARTIAMRGIYQATSRRAVFARDPAIFGMARMMDVYHAMASGRANVRVFYDRKAALEWLGLAELPPV